MMSSSPVGVSLDETSAAKLRTLSGLPMTMTLSPGSIRVDPPGTTVSSPRRIAAKVNESNRSASLTV